MFDAYTIKKVLPRLVIGVILIQLSWFLFTGLLTVVNALAWGLEAIIYAPFGGPTAMGSFADMLSKTSGSGASQIGTTGFLALAAGGAFALGPMGVVSLAITAIVSLFIGFAVLILRQVVLVALLLISPIALVAWILPGTEKIWKIWWESFSKLLLMFPMIVGLIASGRVFAHIAATSSAGNQSAGGLGTVVDVFIVVLGIFGPFFLIPKTFQLAGSAFANLTGMANDRSRGLLDRQRKKRGELVGQRMAERGQALKTGEYFKGRVPGTARAANRLNRITRGAGTGFKGRYGLGASGGSATDSALGNAAAEVAKSASFMAQSENDNVLRAVASGSTRREAERNLQEIFGYNAQQASRLAAQAQATVGFGASKQLAAAQQLVNTGTGYDNLDQMNRVLAAASGGNTNTASRLAGYANATTKKVGRGDLAPGFGSLNTSVHKYAGMETIKSPDSQFGADAPMTADIAEQLFKSSQGRDATTILRGKNPEIKNIAEGLRTHFNNMQQVVSTGVKVDGTAANADDIAAAQNQIEGVRTVIQNMQQSVGMGYVSRDNSAEVTQLAAQLNIPPPTPPGRGGAAPGTPGDIYFEPPDAG